MVFHCIKCEYFTEHKNNWNKHLVTKKHLQLHNQVKKNSTIKTSNYDCEHCGKSYKYLSGLSRHKLKCNVTCVKSEESLKSGIIDVSKHNVDIIKTQQ